jgi:glycosyltransferase involved in cell wall biosynthesis
MKIPNNDLVSVIIPNFNYSAYIEEAIQSVLSQTYDEIEIIVVDDGSTDDSVNRLKKYAKKIKVMETENQGSCAARNLGLLNSSGNFIAFLDADDYWDEQKIELQLRFLKKTKADLTFCGMRSIGGPIKSQELETFEGINHEWFINNPGSTPFAPSSVMMTRGLAAKVGGWNTSLTGPAEDFDYFRKCSKFGDVRELKMTLVNHRQHAESLTTVNSQRYFEDCLRVTRLMLVEDIDRIQIAKRIYIRIIVRFNFLKHAVKTKDFHLLTQILFSFLKVK